VLVTSTERHHALPPISLGTRTSRHAREWRAQAPTASIASIQRMWAWAWGLRSTTACSSRSLRATRIRHHGGRVTGMVGGQRPERTVRLVDRERQLGRVGPKSAATLPVQRGTSGRVIGRRLLRPVVGSIMMSGISALGSRCKVPGEVEPAPMAAGPVPRRAPAGAPVAPTPDVPAPAAPVTQLRPNPARAAGTRATCSAPSTAALGKCSRAQRHQGDDDEWNELLTDHDAGLRVNVVLDRSDEARARSASSAPPREMEHLRATVRACRQTVRCLQS
jgi:hypothetical protein